MSIRAVLLLGLSLPLVGACETRVNGPLRDGKDDTGTDDTDPPDTGETDDTDPPDTDPPDTDSADPDTADTDAPDTSDPDDTGDTGAPDTSDPGDTADTGEPVATEPVDYCHIQYPCALTVPAGATTDPIYAWIYEAGATEGPGVAPRTLLEVGWGPTGSDPTAGGWTWTAMVYNLDKDGLVPGDLANDEWAGELVAPSAAGTYAYAVRASADVGATWTYCDLGGDTCAGSGSDDGYDPGDAGRLLVE